MQELQKEKANGNTGRAEALGVHATCRVPRVTDPSVVRGGGKTVRSRPFVHAAVVVVADEDDDNHRCSVGRRDI